MAVEADAQLHAGLAYDFLLGLVAEEFQHIRMFDIFVDAVVGHVHFPEDIFFCHPFEIVQRIVALCGAEGEQIRVGHSLDGTTELLCVAEQISARDGVGIVQIFDQTVIEKGNIGVENAKPEDIMEALENAHCTNTEQSDLYTKEDLFRYGLVGTDTAKEKREKLGNLLSIGYGNSKTFLKKLNQFQISREEFLEKLKEI